MVFKEDPGTAIEVRMNGIEQMQAPELFSAAGEANLLALG